mmetsp:Transcript_14639/g.36830  ORF Transcript_14639/g.36830 Transcript_14639/m.36830 type:complete len:223 (+) Transcript_14639:683-1351(+)
MTASRQTLGRLDRHFVPANDADVFFFQFLDSGILEAIHARQQFAVFLKGLDPLFEGQKAHVDFSYQIDGQSIITKDNGKESQIEDKSRRLGLEFHAKDERGLVVLPGMDPSLPKRRSWWLAFLLFIMLLLLLLFVQILKDPVQQVQMPQHGITNHRGQQNGRLESKKNGNGRPVLGNVLSAQDDGPNIQQLQDANQDKQLGVGQPNGHSSRSVGDNNLLGKP